jgi:hypothetical protein
MIGAVIGLILLVVFLGVVFYCVQMLLPLIPLAEPFATILRVLVILLVAIVVIYVIIVLLGMAGVHVPTFGSLPLTR